MSNVVNRILTEQMGGRHAETFIGKPGEIFYDAEAGALRIGDGVTPGGQSITESSPLESLFVGPWVYFDRPDDQLDVMDKIADNLILARSNGGSLYNAGESGEGPWQSNGYELNTPYGTQWNTDGWDDFSNVKNRYYSDLTAAWSGGGWAITKHNWVMHDTLNNKYYAIRVLSWDSGNNNATGSFSYIRREINTAIYFNREDTDDSMTALLNSDAVDTGLSITRGDGKAIFNVSLSPQPVSTQFQYSSNDFLSLTWNPDQTVVVVEPTVTMLDALNALKVGDAVGIDTGVTTSWQTVTVPYNPQTGTFSLDYGPAELVNCAFIYLNLPTLMPLETSYNEDVSPIGTLWNAEGHTDLSNLKSRQFMTFDDMFAGQELGKKITGKELVMWDTVNDKYYAINFTRWQNGNAGFQYPGFAWTRRLIDVNKLTSGLKFNDGSIQQTAYSDKIAGVLKQSPKISSSTNTRYINPGDIGKVIYLNSNTSTQYLRIIDGGEADFPVGSTITIINRTGGTVFLYKENDDENGTIYGAGTSNSSNGWQIPDNGGGNICTLMKIETGMDNFFNDWMLAGSNIIVD